MILHTRPSKMQPTNVNGSNIIGSRSRQNQLQKRTKTPDGCTKKKHEAMEILPAMIKTARTEGWASCMVGFFRNLIRYTQKTDRTKTMLTNNAAKRI